MGFTEVASLDADVTIALGKKDKATGKPYPKQAEGYYLGTRSVENKRGESKLHFLQTANGNLGIWGTTDLNRKLASVPAGTMVRITSTGTKPTPNGDMYTYRVEQDSDNTIEVLAAGAGSEDFADGAVEVSEDSYDEDAQEAVEAVQVASQAARKAHVESLLRGKGTKVTKN
jgi:hypothetical protein